MNHNASICIMPGNGQIEVSWEFTTFAKPQEEGFDCVIPAFGIHFYAPNKESMDKKSLAFTQMFFDHYLEGGSKASFKKFVIQIHRLGFHANKLDNLVIKNLLNFNIGGTKTRLNQGHHIVPEGYVNAQASKHNSNKKIAMEA